MEAFDLILEEAWEEKEEVTEPGSPVAYYFRKVKDLELSEAYLRHFSRDAQDVYAQVVKEEYDILYDRIMTSRISPFLKQEVEQWYSFNREFVGFTATIELNRELENMLGRFHLL